jgi:hypothetical protein
MIDSESLGRFLLSVVNADDRSPLSEKREEFAQRYVKWFPRKEDHLYKKANYLDDLKWWNPDGGDFQIERPHPLFGMHVAGLRYKLRVIWKVANDKQWESAERKVGYLKTDIHRYFRLPQEGTNQSWRFSVGRACIWLEKNVRRLKICKNAICERRHFIRNEKNQQYCGAACSADGQSLGGPSQHTKRPLSPEGKKAISDAQERRRERERLAKAQRQP